MRAVSVAVLLCGVQADDDIWWFNLKHKSGVCVHPRDGDENPDDNTDLVYYNECDQGAMKIQFREQPCSEGFMLVHHSGKYVQPEGGTSTPGDGTWLKLHSDIHEDEVRCFEKIPDPQTGYFILRHKHSGQVVHPNHGSVAPDNGTPLVLYHYDNVIETKLLLMEDGPCVPTQVSGQWQYLQMLTGSLSETMTFSFTKSEAEKKTIDWSVMVSNTMTHKGFTEFGKNRQSTTSIQIGIDQSQSYAKYWSGTEEYTKAYDWSAYEGRALWQWQITIEETCGRAIPKTEDFAVTTGRGQPPRCLPGYGLHHNGKTPSYQNCQDSEHTLPGFESPSPPPAPTPTPDPVPVPVPTPVPPPADRCDIDEPFRAECGFYGSHQSDCEASGCCWKPAGEGSTTPWCYHSLESQVSV